MALGFLGSVIGGALSFGQAQKGISSAQASQQQAAQAQLQAQREAIRAQQQAQERQEVFLTRALERSLSATQGLRDIGAEAGRGLLRQAQQPIPATSAAVSRAFEESQALGSRALNRQLAARGLLRSGAGIEQQRALIGQLGTQAGLANIQQGNREAQRRQQILSQLFGQGASLTGQIPGLQANIGGQLGQGALQAGGQLSNLALIPGQIAGGLGQVGAQAALGQAAATQQLIGGLGGALGQLGGGIGLRNLFQPGSSFA